MLLLRILLRHWKPTTGFYPPKWESPGQLKQQPALCWVKWFQTLPPSQRGHHWSLPPSCDRKPSTKCTWYKPCPCVTYHKYKYRISDTKILKSVSRGFGTALRKSSLRRFQLYPITNYEFQVNCAVLAWIKAYPS